MEEKKYRDAGAGGVASQSSGPSGGGLTWQVLLERNVKIFIRRQKHLYRRVVNISDTLKEEHRSLADRVEKDRKKMIEASDRSVESSTISIKASREVLHYLSRLDKLICALMEHQISIMKILQESQALEIQERKDKRDGLTKIILQAFALLGSGSGITLIILKLFGVEIFGP